MNETAHPRLCTACNKHHISVIPGLCPECEKDSAFYKATRKKAEPRQFLPYPELLAQWRRRRTECQAWKKIAGQAARDRAIREQAEREKTYLWAVLNAFNADMEPALSLAAELDTVREDLRRERILSAMYREQAGNPHKLLHEFSRLSERPSFPPEQWRRLVQLAHPDKHGGSVAAAEATRWLLENRP